MPNIFYQFLLSLADFHHAIGVLEFKNHFMADREVLESDTYQIFEVIKY